MCVSRVRHNDGCKWAGGYFTFNFVFALCDARFARLTRSFRFIVHIQCTGTHCFLLGNSIHNWLPIVRSPQLDYCPTTMNYFNVHLTKIGFPSLWRRTHFIRNFVCEWFFRLPSSAGRQLRKHLLILCSIISISMLIILTTENYKTHKIHPSVHQTHVNTEQTGTGMKETERTNWTIITLATKSYPIFHTQLIWLGIKRLTVRRPAD